VSSSRPAWTITDRLIAKPLTGNTLPHRFFGFGEGRLRAGRILGQRLIDAQAKSPAPNHLAFFGRPIKSSEKRGMESAAPTLLLSDFSKRRSS
jgi:hypothetical protein